jgi:hypothetical protein
MNEAPAIAVAYYPEGAGHATRMLAIAEALSDAGASVEMAGGGAGSRFVELNGYDEFEPTDVDFIESYQGGTIREVLAGSVPASADRVADYVGWLRDTEPDALVTDDMFAAIAAARLDVPLYALKHDVPGLYRDRIERTGARFHTGLQLATTRAFFYPAVWPPSDLDPEGATRVPPVALAGDGEPGARANDGEARAGGDDGPDVAGDVLVVPSHYSDLGRVADHLDRQGYDVCHVGNDDWEPVPSLLPHVRAADVVVCSGYSTVMDAAVAGTPCVVHPATDEQEAVADWIDRFDVAGFAVAPEPLDVLEAVASQPTAPDFENGADVVAERVLDDLRTLHRAENSPTAGVAGVTGASVGALTAATGGAPEGVLVATRMLSSAVCRARRAGHRLGDLALAVAVGLFAALYGAAVRGRRYGVALAALCSGIAVLLKTKLGRATRRGGRGMFAGANAATGSVRRLRRVVRRARRVASAAAATLRDGVERLRQSIEDATPR